MNTRILKSLLLMLTVLTSGIALGQDLPDSIRQKRLDSAASARNTDTSLSARMQQKADVVNQRLQEKYRMQLAQSKQERLFANLRAEFQRAKDYMKTGLDTAVVARELRQAEKRIELAGEGIFTNVGTIQTTRNLATSAVLLTEINNRNSLRERQIDEYLLDLEEFRTKIDSLASDSMFLLIPKDTAELRTYLQDLSFLTFESRATDSALNTNLRIVRSLKTKASIIAGNISAKLEEIEDFREELSSNALNKEASYLWESARYSRPFSEIMEFSLSKANIVMFFYMRNHAGKMIVIIAFILFLAYYLRSLKQNVVKAMGEESDLSHALIFERPWASAILITIALGQFLFPSPPFSFYAISWLICSVALTVILAGNITGFWMKFWLVSVALSVASCGLNIILQASRPERIVMLMLSVAGAAAGSMVLFSKHKAELRQKRLVFFLWITVVLETIATFGNIYGRYNLAKGLMTTGFFSLVVGIQLLWTVRLIHEIFNISAEAYRDDENNKFHIDFEKVSTDVPRYLYLILGAGWFILIARNFYIYNQLTQPVQEFFLKEREIGVYSFSLYSIILFMLIILLSAVVSKLVSYFADGRTSRKSNRSGIGSWMLLVRIAIFSIGIFLAFAATGIPMDRIAIVFGALSVGIGFGLQTLVNNLVSGLIIAFEKPLNVGDVVEIGGRSGTMKSIGFRSSVITTFDGSEVIIPNGDLLNQHLINWTLNDNPRRVEILVGVNYGTNLDDVVQLIKDLMAADDRIRRFPESFVLVNNFGNSSIDLRVLFWVSHYTNWNLVRSDLMQGIKRAFDEKGIEIPYPQMVIHNHSSDSQTS